MEPDPRTNGTTVLPTSLADIIIRGTIGQLPPYERRSTVWTVEQLNVPSFPENSKHDGAHGQQLFSSSVFVNLCHDLGSCCFVCFMNTCGGFCCVAMKPVVVVGLYDAWVADEGNGLPLLNNGEMAAGYSETRTWALLKISGDGLPLAITRKCQLLPRWVAGPGPAGPRLKAASRSNSVCVQTADYLVVVVVQHRSPLTTAAAGRRPEGAVPGCGVLAGGVLEVGVLGFPVPGLAMPVPVEPPSRLGRTQELRLGWSQRRALLHLGLRVPWVVHRPFARVLGPAPVFCVKQRGLGRRDIVVVSNVSESNFEGPLLQKYQRSRPTGTTLVCLFKNAMHFTHQATRPQAIWDPPKGCTTEIPRPQTKNAMKIVNIPSRASSPWTSGQVVELLDLDSVLHSEVLFDDILLVSVEGRFLNSFQDHLPAFYRSSTCSTSKTGGSSSSSASSGCDGGGDTWWTFGVTDVYLPGSLATLQRKNGAALFCMMPEDFIFRQLFDSESCTYTYLIADGASGQAVIIDPVIQKVDRDLQLVADLGLTLIYAANTHVHADHITGSGKMKTRLPGLKSVLSEASGGDADLFLNHGDVLNVGSIEIEVRATPGHTN
ncbi:unnamed protein product, partial [Notodromas monacha]